MCSQEWDKPVSMCADTWIPSSFPLWCHNKHQLCFSLEAAPQSRSQGFSTMAVWVGFHIGVNATGVLQRDDRAPMPSWQASDWSECQRFFCCFGLWSVSVSSWGLLSASKPLYGADMRRPQTRSVACVFPLQWRCPEWQFIYNNVFWKYGGNESLPSSTHTVTAWRPCISSNRNNWRVKF